MANKMAELEALLYVAGDDGIEEQNLLDLLRISLVELQTLVTKSKNKYQQDSSGLQLIKINQTYKLTTSPKVSKTIEKYFAKDLTKTLSQSALEILSIIAYRQPITRVEIDEIRGVNSSGALQTLIWRGLVKAKGKKEAPGNPNLYVTTDYFLQYFDFNSLADLPLIEDFENESMDIEDQEGNE
ncbi:MULTISPECIES: SMC-Scp complex subunit ScpB [Lactobacillus]|uniref:Segregation and condensation protein B n=1 Tax=Lactobacillus xujianguonis TaxID=2495899 RepID=A0A437SY40_9LACO|nr:MULTISPECIES: SMC-Scp complex subunit ScpB [Lactobacillus]RVU71835.1 SMC-Scp complex subunit ScpB [Lactobacillus xujianguonis]RVU77611.1 SMC-Scp complex subunit ScpB [Lactobacillus xujianguonis]